MLKGSRENPIDNSFSTEDRPYCGEPPHEWLMGWLYDKPRVREVWLTPGAFMQYAVCLGRMLGTIYPCERFAVEILGPNELPVWVRAAVKET